MLMLDFNKISFDKSDLLLIGSKSIVSPHKSFGLEIDGTSPTAHNLGDSALTLEDLIHSLSKMVFFFLHLRSITRLHPALSTKDAEVLIRAFIASQ